MRLACRAIIGTLSFALAATPSPASAGIVIESDGSIAVDLVSGSGRGVVVRVNPVTGAMSIVSSETVGSGPILPEPQDIAVEGAGSLVTVHNGSILRIDRSTGDRSVLSNATTGAGPAVEYCRGAAVGADGTLFVSMRDLQSALWSAVLKVAPTTGDRTLVSDASTGEGPLLVQPRGLAVEAAGDLVVADYRLRSIVRVDPATGDRALVSGPARGSGPALKAPVDVAVEAGGTLAVADAFSDRWCLTICRTCSLCMRYGPSLIRVDPASGDRTLVSGGGWFVSFQEIAFSPTFGQRGAGPRFLGLGAVAVESDQAYIVESRGGVMRVDAATGRRSMVANLDEVSSSAGGPRARRAGRTGRTSSDLAPLTERQPDRTHAVARPRDWLRNALGPDYDALIGNRPMETLLDGLSPAQRHAIGRRLYAAVWAEMRDALGQDHPEVLDAMRQ